MKAFIIVLFFFSFSTWAQLELYPTSPIYMENGDLFGPNYQIYDVEYYGAPSAYAQFNGVNTNLGLTRGFVLTTGEVANWENGILGPNNSSEAGVDLPANEEHIHPYLGPEYTGGNGGDGAYISLKFIPSVDSLVFNYSFGSDEYLEFVGSIFADPVGIYVSGPGINGIQNLLKIGGDDVSISTVHSDIQNAFGAYYGVNEAFFRNNDTVGTDVTKIEYDGFTINTKARLENLQIGQEYEMVIAIADAVDHLFDSGLFIEACETCVPTLGQDELITDGLRVYPNPMDGNELTITAGGEHLYRITDISGREIQVGVLVDSIKFELSHLSYGTYVVILDNGSSVRVIKQ